MIKLRIIKKTVKNSVCAECGKIIDSGSTCLSANGTDYDAQWINEHVHGSPENCYITYLEKLDNIDMKDIEDFTNQFHFYGIRGNHKSISVEMGHIGNNI